MLKNSYVRQSTAMLCMFALTEPAFGWSNRGHRMINLVAAESLPADMPAFMRTPQAIAEISYLGPEPDRWRGETEPELSHAHTPNHVFRMELAEPVSPLPRGRLEYTAKLEKLRLAQPGPGTDTLRTERTGTLPWQAEEVYERLQSAFRSYRIATGDIPQSAWPDEAPIRREDLPAIEASVLYYAGELGHYIGDASMPLHDTVNIAGWVQKDNPHGYTTKGAIHHQFELVADSAIEQSAITDKKILPMVPPVKVVDDPFAATLGFVQAEAKFVPGVYEAEKAGEMKAAGTPALQGFIEARMAEGGSLLRDLIYTAWIHSKESHAPAYPSSVPLDTLQ